MRFAAEADERENGRRKKQCIDLSETSYQFSVVPDGPELKVVMYNTPSE